MPRTSGASPRSARTSPSSRRNSSTGTARCSRTGPCRAREKSLIALARGVTPCSARTASTPTRKDALEKGCDLDQMTEAIARRRRDPRRRVARPRRADAEQGRRSIRCELSAMAARTLPTLTARGSRSRRPWCSASTCGSLPARARLRRGAPRARRSAPLRPTRIEIFQINVGKLCNQTCRHCHVDAGPERREVMTRETMELCLARARRRRASRPSTSPAARRSSTRDFRWLVERVPRARPARDGPLQPHRARDAVRTATCPSSSREHEVEVVCSLPHYREARHRRAARRGRVQRVDRARCGA